MPIRRFNPAWLATLDLRAPTALTVRDHAVLLEVAGTYAATRFDPAGRGPEVRKRIEVLRDGGEVEHRTRVPIVDLRSDLRIAALRDLTASLDRLRGATNGGLPLFAELYVDEGEVVVVHARNRALLDAHVAFAQKALNKKERWYVNVDVTKVALMSSSVSVPYALRLVAWLRSPTRVGLEEVLQLKASSTNREMGTPGQIQGYVRASQIRETLGLCREGVVPAVVDRAKATVIADARLLDVETGWSWRRSGRQVAGLTFSGVGMSLAWTPDDEVEVREPTPVRLRGALPSRVMPEPMPVEPDPEADPEDDVERPPVRSRPGRFHLTLVPTTDAVEPMTSAPVDTSPVTSSDDVEAVDDGEEYVWTDEDDENEARDDHVYFPAPKAVAPVAPVDEPSDDGEPVYDSAGFEIPFDKRPPHRPVYADDGFDQHGYDRGGYGRDGAHWLTGLLADEVSAGVKKPGIRGTFTVVGALPTDRDRWVKSWVHPDRPPAETPHWSPRLELWMSVTEDESYAAHRFPIHVWQKDNRHDVVEWHLDPATCTPVRHHEPVAVKVADWPEVQAYSQDLSAWAEERPVNLGDLPGEFVVPVERLHDMPWIMSHARKPTPTGD